MYYKLISIKDNKIKNVEVETFTFDSIEDEYYQVKNHGIEYEEVFDTEKGERIVCTNSVYKAKKLFLEEQKFEEENDEVYDPYQERGIIPKAGDIITYFISPEDINKKINKKIQPKVSMPW